ncbi:hypothetical protein MBLNU230_g0788t1 [Neophaeotheca triangularis]
MAHAESSGQGFSKVETKLDHDPKPIETARFTTQAQNPLNGLLIFSHGAGGDMTSPAVTNFAAGFAPHLDLITFNSPTSLPARTKQFATLLTTESASNREIVLGGRSMGARAAVMAATEHVGTCSKRLVLVSYPLHTEKHGTFEMRDGILLDLPAECEVLFLSGERDSMCEQSRLADVRGRMRARSWVVVVRGANHTMEMKPGSATGAVGAFTGEVAARWLAGEGRGARESEIEWHSAHGEARWSAAEKGEGHHGFGAALKGFKERFSKHEGKGEDVSSRTRSQTDK